MKTSHEELLVKSFHAFLQSMMTLKIFQQFSNIQYTCTHTSRVDADPV